MAGTRIGRVWVYEQDADVRPGQLCFRLVIENGAATLGRWVAHAVRVRSAMGDYSILYERQS
jgi:hypothetical protein